MTIHYQLIGQGEPLIMIHGLFGTSDNLKQIAKGLAEYYAVYLVDGRCHGQSSSLDEISHQAFANALFEFADSLELSQFSILGHSLGGKIAMEMALLQPQRINKLIVADIAPVQYPARHNKIIAALQSVPLNELTGRKQADSILAEHIDEAGIRGFLLKSLSNQGDSSWAWQFDLTKLAENYSQIALGNSENQFTGETLFIHGGNSNYLKPEYKPEIQSRFPNASSKMIQGAGHWLHAEKPVIFIKLCKDFLLGS